MLESRVIPELLALGSFFLLCFILAQAQALKVRLAWGQWCQLKLFLDLDLDLDFQSEICEENMNGAESCDSCDL